jgi:hypothetical protein
MSDDLVERLRYLELRITAGANEACGKAADRIEAQETEIRSLREQVAELEAELGYHGIYPNPIIPRDTKADSDGDDGA